MQEKDWSSCLLDWLSVSEHWICTHDNTPGFTRYSEELKVL